MNKITPNLVKLITKIRKLVTASYNKYAHNVDNMFNVCVCNYYTQKQHKISAHRVDERWLQKNLTNKHDNSKSSIINRQRKIYRRRGSSQRQKRKERMNSKGNRRRR